jgi:hypothetical protein
MLESLRASDPNIDVIASPIFPKPTLNPFFYMIEKVSTLQQFSISTTYIHVSPMCGGEKVEKNRIDSQYIYTIVKKNIKVDRVI